jgi:hypothetical protein
MSAEAETDLPVDAKAFALALLLAPVVFAGLTFWLLFIPVLALLSGYLPFVLFGGPVFFLMLFRYAPTIGFYARGGLAAHLIFVAAILLVSSDFTEEQAAAMTVTAVWGIPFALAWGGTFAALYRALHRARIT